MSPTTQGLQCSSFLVMTYFLTRDYNILPKKELLWSPWVGTRKARFDLKVGSRRPGCGSAWKCPSTANLYEASKEAWLEPTEPSSPATVVVGSWVVSNMSII